MIDLDAIRERGAIVPYSVEEHVRLTVEERDALVGRIRDLEAEIENSVSLYWQRRAEKAEAALVGRIQELDGRIQELEVRVAHRRRMP